MAEPSERVTVRIPAELLEKLKTVQTARGIATISDAIREGLERFVEMNLPPPNIRKVVVDLSRRDNQELEAFVREGGSVSVDDAVRAAVREYIRGRIAELGSAARHRREIVEPVAATGGAPSP
jgi:metal-responsive CopG/Arc/MetJ family transcriptional regulator